MGRKKIPPPEQTFHVGDRVQFVDSHDCGGITGIIHRVFLCGTGSSQCWAYFVLTHRYLYHGRYCDRSRLSIRTYNKSLILLKRKPLKSR